MNEIIFLIKEADEGGYTAEALGHHIFTEADTIDELKNMIKDAVDCHFDSNDFTTTPAIQIRPTHIFYLFLYDKILFQYRLRFPH